MSRNLLGNLEDEAPDVLVEHGYKKLGRGLFGLLLMAFFAFLLAGNAVAQTDYSGTYYIATRGYDGNPANTNNYYMCPTEGWIYYKPTNNWSEDGTTYPNPFITTYRCKTNAYHSGDPSNAVWIIEKHPTEDYYYIKHASDGKYMVSSGQITGTSNANRMRVHIETVAQSDLDDKALFSITPYTQTFSNVVYSYLVISPKSSAGWNGDKRWYTVNGGNQNYLIGYGSNGGPGDYSYTGGVIGIYTESDINAQFYLEEYCPIIAYNENNLIEIKELPGFTIYYTTDWTDPSSTNGTQYTGAFDVNDTVTTIKAVAYYNGLPSDVAIFRPFVLLGSNHKRLIQNQGNPWEYSNNTYDYHFYMIPGDNEEINGNTVTKVNTTSLFRPSMEWYLSNAGVENNVQYYYIVNNSNGKYLCYDANNTDYGVYMDTYNSNNANIFKFSIVERPGTGTYNFIPYGQERKYLNKGTTGNSAANATPVPIDLRTENSGTSTSSQYARWKFILPSELDRNAPFNASDPTNQSYPYYTITTVGTSNNVSTTYYLAPGTTNVQTLTSSNVSALWYFEVAQVADATDWLTYYHIRNAVTGDYLYFDIDSYNANIESSCFKTSSTIEGNAERYKFTWAKTASTTVNYYIDPKLMKDATLNNIGTLTRWSNTNVRLQLTRTTGTRVWTFGSSTFTFNPPTISYDATQGGYVISSSETGAEFYYTTNGDDPTLTSGTPPTFTSTHYTSAIQVANWPDPTVTTLTIKAIAARNGDGSDASTVVSKTVYRVSTPIIIPQTNGTVKITCDTVGARIYYAMDDTQPTSVPIDQNHLYTGPIEGAGGKYITAIAVKDGLINSALEQSGQIIFTCATPVIRKTSATTFTIECSFPSDANIRYTMGDNPDDPTPTTGYLYSGTVTFDESDLPFTVKAIAYATNYNNSAVATKVISDDLPLDDEDGFYIIASYDDYAKFVSMVNESEDNASAKYKITVDIDVSDIGVIDQYSFAGELKSVAKADGTYPVLSGLSHSIFETVDGGQVHHIMLQDIDVSGEGNVGAICNEAKGYSRIYSCGILPTTASFPDGAHSTVTATGNNGCAGGIVGLLDDDSRVVNCFSYADIYSSGYAAGIVGNNTFASTAEVENVSGTDKYTHLRTMVVNCIYYGDIKSGSSIWPVYGGQKISNRGDYAINNYNFYSDSCDFVSGFVDYNCSWPARYNYLTRYEFLRYTLNSNRELCGWWVGASQAPSTMATTDVQAVPKDGSLMAKWVLDPAMAPFPILKAQGKYSSPINIDADAEWRESAQEWEGKNLGTLSVTVKPGSHAASGVPSSVSIEGGIVITDMDTLRGDFCYRKIQLPYYNSVFGDSEGETWAAKYAGNYTNYVVTGWEITGVTGGTTGQLLQDWQYGYNFADRDCTVKDQSPNRIFAQGGYYYVPNGVTAIEITAHWGKAFYLGNGDNYYDRVDFDHLVRKSDDVVLRKNHRGTAFEPAGVRLSTLPNGEIIRTDSITAVAAACITTQASVYDNALVLVNNHQFCQGPYDIKLGNSKTLGFTIMSADFDLDDEPDYCLEWQLGQGTTRQSICPIRFDFLPVVEIGLCLKKEGSEQYYSLGCYRPFGHFEVTETSLIRFGQFEFSNINRTLYAPIILNGGIYEQYVKSTRGNAFTVANDRIDYIILGGNVYMFSFTPGAHVNPNAGFPTRHCAVNVIGGRIDKLYLAGNYNESVTPNQDNPHCYIDGGWFRHMASAGKEGIDGDVTFKINHAVIHEFYGGGIMSGHEVTGNIDVTIDNSRVGKYCGGPKFGDMTLDVQNPATNKTVTTRATHTTFKDYFGAGNGGTNYVQYDRTDGTYVNISSFNWGSTGHMNNYIPGKYRQGYANYMADYDMEMINVSTGTYDKSAVIRTYFYAAQYAATNTGRVSNTLTDCTVYRNFYGAGNLGGVEGVPDENNVLIGVKSILTDTRVHGSVFGAGFSASIPEVTIRDGDRIPPIIDLFTGYITPQTEGTTTTYTWTHESSINGQTLNPQNPTIMNVMVNGVPKNFFYTEDPLQNLGTVHGDVSLIIKGESVIGTEGDTETGFVFGGGYESAVNGSITVKLQGKTRVLNDVFAGGNKGTVSGNTSVTIEAEPPASSTSGPEPDPGD